MVARRLRPRSLGALARRSLIALCLVAGGAAASPDRGAATIPTGVAGMPVVPPADWVEDRALGAEVLAGITRSVGAGVATAFHPPGDPATRLVLVSVLSPETMTMTITPRRFLDAGVTSAIDREVAAGMSVVSRRAWDDRGQALAEYTLAYPDGRSLVARNVVDVTSRFGELRFVGGFCVGSGDLLARCRRALGGVGIPIDPARAPAGDGANSWLLALAGGAFALGLLGLALRGVKRRRDLRRAPRLVDHEVMTVTGIVVAGEHVLTAPLSGHACVAHRASARLRGRPSAAVHSEQASTAFVVATAAGPVCVDPGELALDLVPLVVLDHAVHDRTAFLERQGIDPVQRGQLSFDEIVIAPGSRISIRGMIRIGLDQGSASERGYREALPSTARLVATAPTAPVTVVRSW